MKLPTDHIYVILAAFLAVLAAFTTTTIIGTDPSSTATLRDVLLALGGALGTAYVANHRADGSGPPSS
jgi:VIT1/CCC1 family predicted Fe2+/Mn2+ transporter